MGAAYSAFLPLYGSEGLTVALWGSGILGTVYSLEPFRLKRFPFLAAFCIVVVRGTVINAGFFAHARAVALGVLGNAGATAAGGAASVGGLVGKGVWGCLREGRCLLSCLFFAVFGIVIALMKDVPDVKGDALFNIKSFTVRIGPKTIFHASRRLLATLFYGVSLAFTTCSGLLPSFITKTTMMGMVSAVTNTVTMEQKICRMIVAFSAALAGWSVRREAMGVDPEEAGEVYGYYMHLWKLFYLSYLVLPFAR